MFDKVFWQVVVILNVALGGSKIMVRVYLGEVLRKFFIELGYESSYNSMCGLVMVCFEAGDIIGCILSGKIVDHFKNYHQQVSIALACSVISVVSVLLGYYFGNSLVVFVFHFMFGIGIGYITTPLYEIVFQHFFPADSGVL